MITVPNVNNIIAVASGKGGVGKSTTAVNLALALSLEEAPLKDSPVDSADRPAQGCAGRSHEQFRLMSQQVDSLKAGSRVGILDADIYGPSQPMMLGVQQVRPEMGENKTLKPVMSHGIQSMSIGYLIDQDTPMVWRGPMVSTALQQLFRDTVWDNLDYLVVDLPPGTGDIQLTLSQKIPVTGAVIVTTPQDIALLDARKAIAMFEKVRIPVLGVIENMSLHICSECGHAEPIFGEGGGKRIAEQYGVDFLGALPLDLQIREQTDSGCPPVAADPEGKIALLYREIARNLIAKLALQRKPFPKITIREE